MKRILPPLVAALFVGLAWLLPDVSNPRLAALEAHRVLAETVDPAGAEPEEEAERTLADVVLDGSAVRTVSEEERELKLHGVVLRAPAEPSADVLDLHVVARRALVRGLRQAAQERGRTLRVVGEQAPGPETEGGAVFEVRYEEEGIAVVYAVDGDPQPVAVARTAWTPPSSRSVLPALLAIALAILVRRPVPALFLGVIAGAFLIELRGGASVGAAVPGAATTFVTKLLLPELRSNMRYEIVLFVLFMLAMVGVITRNGGVRGLMQRIAKRAGSARGSQAATYLMGLAVFFDDYANTILVGSTMRPLTDRWRVSREKLAYLIDSTAAPVAGLAVLSTWIAFEVSTFSAQLPAAGLSVEDGYRVFLQTLPYRFYCVLTLVFVGAIAFSGRDYGTMLAAERRARRTGKLVREGGRPMVSEESLAFDPAPGVQPRALAAVAPILTFVGVTLAYIAWTGGAFGPDFRFTFEGLTGVLYEGSGSAPLMYGSGAGLLVAVVLSLAVGVGFRDVVRSGARVVMGMGVAILILYLAWMIGRVCDELGTAPYLTALIGDALDARLLPAVLFVLAGFVAFSTGSSWSTMSILLPIVVGLAYGLGLDAGLAETAAASGRLLMLMSIGAVLEGAIFGDHCSPISDTTVLSSIASSSDHVDHVRTQIPYAVTTMLLAMAVGYLPCAFYGLSPWIGLLVGAGAAVAVVLFVGRRADGAPEEPLG